MSFAHPWAFWFLGLALPITVVHLYRGRRRRMEVPCLRLWAAALQDAPDRSAPVLWLQHLLGLLLSLAVLSFLALGLAGPGEAPVSAGIAGPDARPVAIVLDATLSLRAREGTARRFDLATAEADRLVRAARGPVRVFCAGRGAESVIDASADPTAWPAWLAARAPAAPAGTLVPALRAAAAWLGTPGGGRLVLLTDGAARDEAGLADAVRETGAEVRLCGTPLPNLAIVEGGASRAWGEKEAQIFFRVRNFSDAARDVTMAATLDDQPARNLPLKLAAEADEAVAFPLAVEGEGRLTLRLLADDALPEDNAMRIVVPARRRPRVFVFQTAGGNAFLRRALEVLGDRIDAAASGFAPPHAWEEVAPTLRPGDVAIFDGCGPTGDLRPAGYLFLRGRGPFVPVTGTEVESPGAFAWRHGPLASALPDIAGLRVRSALALRVERGMETVLDSDRGALAVSGESPGGARFIALGFRLDDSNLPLLAAFPVFLRNAFDWLVGEERRHLPAALPMGEPLAIDRPVPSPGAEAVVTRIVEDGDGPAARGPWRFPLRDGRGRLAGLPDPGYYRVEAGAVREWTAVNVANRNESDLRPVALPGASPVTAVAGAAAPAPGWTASALLVAGAVLLLILEWWLFERGLL
jgi:hypothetical protein